MQTLGRQDVRRAEQASVPTLIVIAGFNGLASVQAWLREFTAGSGPYHATAYAWRDADKAARLAASAPGPVTLIGHSLGAGCAQLIAQRLPPGATERLITVAPFAPREVDPIRVRAKVGHWLNIVSAHSWRDTLLNLTSQLFMGWRDQGPISSATENYISKLPHQDFYRMMSERCGAVEHGQLFLPMMQK